MISFKRLDRIQSRSVNIAKRTTFRIRRSVWNSIDNNVILNIGSDAREISGTLDKSMSDAFIAGFETTVPESGLTRVRKKYNISRSFRSSAIENFFAETITSLEKTISELRFSKASKARKRRVLKEEFERLGLTGNPYRIEAIFNTATAEAFNAGRMEGFSIPQNSDGIWGFRWQTAQDDRVRPNHRAMQGVTAPKDHRIWDIWTAPAGYNCRCWVEDLSEPSNIVLPQSGVLPDPGFR